MNEFNDPVLGRMVAVEARGCNGCSYVADREACLAAPQCSQTTREDCRGVIWVRAADSPALVDEVRGLAAERADLDAVVCEVSREIWCEPNNEAMLVGVDALRLERDLARATLICAELAVRLADSVARTAPEVEHARMAVRNDRIRRLAEAVYGVASIDDPT